MGKGVIISGGENGLYQVQVKYNRDRYDATITALNAKKAELEEARAPIVTERDAKQSEVDAKVIEAQTLADEYQVLLSKLETYQQEILALENELSILQQELTELRESGIASDQQIQTKENEIAAKRLEITEKQAQIDETKADIEEKYKEYEEVLKEANTLNFELREIQARLNDIDLQITSINKRIQFLSENMPDDETVQAWCADLTEDLTGTIGTVEIPGERGILQIQPGHNDNAVWNQTRDGQLFPTISMTPAQAFFNLAMMPGWQKWRPTFRHGTITALDGDTASVSLESVKSSQQDLKINQDGSLSGVQIEYMDCNGSAFKTGDEVLVMFGNYRFANPKIIGFKEEPKPCTMIIPYLYASEDDFPAGGLLLCHGGRVPLDSFSLAEFDENSLKFTAEYELFSPYGPASHIKGSLYQPDVYDGIVLDYLVKDFTDETGVYWNEIPPVEYSSDPRVEWAQTSFVRGGEFFPDYWVTSSANDLRLGDTVFFSGYSHRWYEDEGGTLHWYWNARTIGGFNAWAAAADPTKYMLIYTTYDWTADSYSHSSYSNQTKTNYQLWFRGLGHSHQFTDWNGGSTRSKIRLCCVNGQYVALFSIRYESDAGTQEYIGCAIDGGGFTLTDISGGVEYEGETRNLIAGATLGLIQRGRAAEK